MHLSCFPPDQWGFLGIIGCNCLDSERDALVADGHHGPLRKRKVLRYYHKDCPPLQPDAAGGSLSIILYRLQDMSICGDIVLRMAYSIMPNQFVVLHKERIFSASLAFIWSLGSFVY